MMTARMIRYRWATSFASGRTRNRRLNFSEKSGSVEHEQHSFRWRIVEQLLRRKKIEFRGLSLLDGFPHAL